jgi:predicted flap endonuclease-1-like 5' DNA nuclease
MKNLTTGEITPPLPHDEYMEEFQKNVEAERKEKADKAKSGARGRTTAVVEEEPEFHGKPLRFYDGKSDDDITKIPGIGEGTLEKIRAAQKKHGRK